MKGIPIAFFLIALPVFLSLTSCGPMDEVSTSNSTSGYELGKTKGYQDGRGGLSRTPSRYESSYSQADRSEFFRGYEDGYNDGIKPGASAPSVKETPNTGPVPTKVINDCIDTLQKQIPGKDIMLISAKRGETSYIVDLAVRGAEKPWRCYHDGTRCTGTEYQGEG
jgi:hypothetical protein